MSRLNESLFFSAISLDADERLPERRQRAREREAARWGEHGQGGVREGEERAVPFARGVELVKEWVVDHAEHGGVCSR